MAVVFSVSNRFYNLPLVSKSSVSMARLDLVNDVRPTHAPGLVTGQTYTKPELFTAEPGAVPFGAPTSMLRELVRGPLIGTVLTKNSEAGCMDTVSIYLYTITILIKTFPPWSLVHF